jgi:hypothetical protein
MYAEALFMSHPFIAGKGVLFLKYAANNKEETSRMAHGIIRLALILSVAVFVGVHDAFFLDL